MTRWILASASPRRRELLQQMGLHDFEVIPAQSQEQSDARDPGARVEDLARHKAAEVYRRVMSKEDGAYVSPKRDDTVCVIGADTIVVCGGQVLGKPADREDAARMIRMLQGRSHEVMTGVCLIRGAAGAEPAAETFHVETKVHVAAMDEEEIRRYLETGEADDKAGAYGIQGAFGTFIEGIEGDYYNVVGLPIAALYRVIRKKHLAF